MEQRTHSVIPAHGKLREDKSQGVRSQPEVHGEAETSLDYKSDTLSQKKTKKESKKGRKKKKD